MNAQEMANHLGVTERTVRRWIERKELPAQRQGRSFVIRREDGERKRLGPPGPTVIKALRELKELTTQLEQEHAELKGRYLQSHDQILRLEEALNAERRKSARFELLLEAAQPRRAA